MNKIMIETNQLCRSFGKKQAIDRVSLSISRGTVCSLLGPNGAGKTTLLKLLHGLILPTFEGRHNKGNVKPDGEVCS